MESFSLDSFSSLKQDDSLNLRDVISSGEFDELTKQLKILERHQKESSDQKRPKWWTHSENQTEVSGQKPKLSEQDTYLSQYAQWLKKPQQQKLSSHGKKQITEAKFKASATQKRNSSEIEEYRRQLQLDEFRANRDFMKSKMVAIEKQYRESLQKVIESDTNSHKNISKPQCQSKSNNKVQENQRQQKTFSPKSQVLQESLINSPPPSNRDQSQNIDELKQFCFQTLIKRPPPCPINCSSPIEIVIQQDMVPTHDFEVEKYLPINCETQNNAQELQNKSNASTIVLQPQRQSSPKIKLNIQKIISLPAKQFLIFYDQNYRKIINLCSPEQLRKVEAYRQSCLLKFEAAEKLRQRVKNEGQQFLDKLKPEQKQKLFRVLYDQLG